MYCYRNQSSILTRSSSGGAFMAIAKWFFRNYPDGFVYGVTMNGTSAVYDVASSYEDCARFQGSKYIFAKPKMIFEDIFNKLQNDKAVLFVGTPCLVYALKNSLERKNLRTDQLFTIDLICHGTGDASFWKDYVNYIEKKYSSKIKEYYFRDKKQSWSGYPVRIVFENGKEIVDNYESRIFIRAYLKQLCMRKSCYECKFKTKDRLGEWTLGDFWGIEKSGIDIPIKDGVSLIILNSDKGKAFIEDTLSNASKGETIIRVDEIDALMRQDNLKGAQGNPQYNEFWHDYHEKGYMYAIKKYNIYTIKGVIRYGIIQVLKKLGIYSALKRKYVK